MLKMKTILMLVVIANLGGVLSMCNPNDGLTPIWNHKEFPCNRYFKVCRFHHEGREGLLQLPVKQNMKPDEDNQKELERLFENGDVNITFSHPINALDVPEGDHGQRKTKANQEFTIFIKDVYRGRMEKLKSGDNFNVDVTFRSQMLKPDYSGKKLGISALSFGNFQCPPPPPKLIAPVSPLCRMVMLDETQPDGYRAAAIFPIEKTTQNWEAEIVFPVDVRDFQSPDGDTKRRESEDLPAIITNLRHNGKQLEDQEFTLEFNIHFKRENKRLAKKVVSMRFNDWKCEGVVIRHKVWN